MDPSNGLLAWFAVELILIRHAEAETAETRDGTPADPKLTSRGREQARAVAHWLLRKPIDRILSSPARRARETAEVTASRAGLELTVDPRLREIDPDASHYVSIEQERARGREAYQARIAAYQIDPRLVGLSERVDEALSQWATRHAGGRVVVFCHGGVINVWTCLILGLPPAPFLEAQNAGSHRFLISRSGLRSIQSLNETAYLDWASPEPPRR
jgi:probable phosphoglycerate mutase